MNITTDQIKTLRDATGISIMQCRKALEEAGGDMDKAKIILEKKSKAAAEKKVDRELKAGTIGSYIHATGTAGSLVELACETDFVGKNEDFRHLAREIAMHVTAMSPKYVSTDEITAEEKAKVAEVFEKDIDASKTPEMKAKILEGKLGAYFAEKTLLAQPYIKNGDKTIQNLIEEATQKYGEKIAVSKFVRFVI